MVRGRPRLASQTMAQLPSYVGVPSQTVITPSWVILSPISLLHLPMSSARAGMESVRTLSVAPHLTMVSTHECLLND